MRCYECNKIEMKLKKITVDFIIEGVKVIVTNVPAYVCSECGENAIKPDVLENLEKITANIRKMLKEQEKKPSKMIYELAA